MVERKGRTVGTGSVGTEGMGVMGGDTHRQCWDGRECCVVMTKRKGRKVGTGSFGTEGMGVMGGDTHRMCWDGRQCCVLIMEHKGGKASMTENVAMVAPIARTRSMSAHLLSKGQ